MRILLSAIVLFASLAACAQQPMLRVTTNGVLGWPGNFFSTNKALIEAALSNGFSVILFQASTQSVGTLIITNPVAIAYGGTGASSASAALSNLGGQPADSDLTDLSDGELDGAKIGPGVNAANVTAGKLPIARIGSSGTPSASTYYRGDDSWQTIAGSSFAWSLDTVTTLTNINTADFVPMWTNAVPSGETHILQSEVGMAGQTNRTSYLLRAVLANRGGTGAGFANAVISSQTSDASAVAHWTNSGTNMVLMVRTPSNEPVMVHAWGMLRKMTNAGTYGGPPSTYIVFEDFEGVGSPAGDWWENGASASYNYDSTTAPISGSTEQVSIDTTSGAGRLVYTLPATNGALTIYFAHKRPSVTSTVRRIFEVYDESTNVLAFLQSTSSGGVGFRAYHGNVSNTVSHAHSSLSSVWTYHWVTYRQGSGSDGYMRWLVATNAAATGTTSEVTISTGTSTAPAKFLAFGHNATLSSQFYYDEIGIRTGTNSITSPRQDP